MPSALPPPHSAQLTLSSHELTGSQCRATGPMTMFAWPAVMAASSSCATYAPLHITSSVSALIRCNIPSLPSPYYCASAPTRGTLPCRYQQACGSARTTRAVCVKRKAKTAATVSSGIASPPSHSNRVQFTPLVRVCVDFTVKQEHRLTRVQMRELPMRVLRRLQT